MLLSHRAREALVLWIVAALYNDVIALDMKELARLFDSAARDTVATMVAYPVNYS